MQAKWNVLSLYLLKAGTYFEDRLTARQLSGRFYAQRAVTMETNETEGDRTIYAFGAFWPTCRSCTPKWYEVGTLWVHPERRGNGLLPYLLNDLMAKAPEGAPLFLITKEGAVMRAIADHGFQPVTIQSFEGDLMLWAQQTGLGRRLPETAYRPTPEPFPGERWLFMRQ